MKINRAMVIRACLMDRLENTEYPEYVHCRSNVDRVIAVHALTVEQYDMYPEADKKDYERTKRLVEHKSPVSLLVRENIEVNRYCNWDQYWDSVYWPVLF